MAGDDIGELAEALEAIDRWMLGSPFGGSDRDKYMRAMSRRAMTFAGVEVDANDPVHFVIRMRELLALAKVLTTEIKE